MSTGRDLPVNVKIAVIIGGSLRVRFLTVAVLPKLTIEGFPKDAW